MSKIAFIGSGSMARAIIAGLVRTGTPGDDILVVNPNNPTSCGEVHALYGTVTAPAESVAEAGTVVIAVKPQSFTAAYPVYAPHVKPGTLVVSIMAGIPTAAVEAAFPGARVVRVMPNLALAVGYGAAGVAPGASATEADVRSVIDIFSPGGVAVAVTESQIDDVAALSGSGAAYIYYMVENLRDAAIEAGIAPDTAAMLARQTLLGAARQLELEDVPPEELRRRITSKKGTTEAAINALDEHGFPAAVRACYNANKRRSRELSEVERPRSAGNS